MFRTRRRYGDDVSRRSPKSSRSSNRGFARTDRLGSLLREIIGDELRRIDDDRVAYVTVTDVEVDNELTRAKVFLSTLNLEDSDLDGVRAYMGRIRKAVAREGQLRRVPYLDLQIDPGLRAGTRVGEILQSMEADHDRAFATDDASEEE